MSERDAAREILRELLHEALAGPNGNGVTPQIPPPPVAAVHRPSTWARRPAASSRRGAGAGAVTLDSDADLDRFVRALLARFAPGRARGDPRRAAALHAQPRERRARSGAVRVERGAVTERKVEEAAKAGARLVLGPGAVLTPLARDKARAKGIEIEREQARC